MTTLVAIGDSHTSGSMITGVPSPHEVNIKKTFAGRLAERHGWKHHNLGMPGGSNAYIYRSTIKYINEQLRPNKDYLFIIGWTSTARMELRYPDNTDVEYKVGTDFFDHKYMPFSYGTAEHLFHSREAVGLMRSQDLLFYPEILADNWAAYVLVLQNLFKRKGIKYLMFNACFEIETTPTNIKMIENFDTTHYIDPLSRDKSLLYWGLNKGFEKTDCWHLKADAHLAWSKFLEKELLRLGYL